MILWARLDTHTHIGLHTHTFIVVWQCISWIDWRTGRCACLAISNLYTTRYLKLLTLRAILGQYKSSI